MFDPITFISNGCSANESFFRVQCGNFPLIFHLDELVFPYSEWPKFNPSWVQGFPLWVIMKVTLISRRTTYSAPLGSGPSAL